MIYQQSDQKGFRRWLISFKAAVLFAASAAGLIPLNTEAIEPHVSNNSPSIERTLSNQELDSLDDPNSQAILVKTGDSTPSVPTSPGRAQPNNFPTGSTGGRRTPHVNPYRTPPRVVDQGLGAGVNPIDIGKKSTNLPGNKVLIKGAHGRYVVEISGDQVNVLGIGARGNNKNMKTFQKLMNEMYDLNLQY